MTEVWFYHLERSPLDAVLPDLLTKTLDRGWRALVRTGSQERLQALDSHLWTFRDDSFLPHGTAGRPDAAEQPVLLTDQLGNPNRAEVLFLVDRAASPELGGSDLAVEGEGAYERIILLFDGRDGEAVSEARTLWKNVKATEAGLAYWKQSPSGKWEKKA